MTARGSAEMFALPSPATVAGTQLVQLGRVFSPLEDSMTGLALNPLPNLLVAARAPGVRSERGDGLEAASTTAITEAFASGLMLVALLGDGVDRRLITRLPKNALLALIALGVHTVLAPFALRRAPLEDSAHVVVGRLSGALPPGELASATPSAPRMRPKESPVTYRDER